MKRKYLYFPLIHTILVVPLLLLAATVVQAKFSPSPVVHGYDFEFSGFVEPAVAHERATGALMGQDHYIKIAEADGEDYSAAVTANSPDIEQSGVAAPGSANKTEENISNDPATVYDRGRLAHDESVSVTEQPLSLDDFITLVRQKNEKIIAQQLEYEISKEALNSARSIFEPDAVTSYQHQVSEKSYTAEDKARAPLSNLADRNDRDNNYNAVVEGLLPTGGKVNLGYSMADFSNVYNESSGREYQTDLAVDITQPLLKNAGVQTTMANIHMAKADSYISFQGYRQQMAQVIHDATIAYWELALARAKHKIAVDSVALAGKILADSRERLKFGKVAETDVLEAEAGLASRQSLELAARSQVSAAMDNLRNFISTSAVDFNSDIQTTTELASDNMPVNLTAAIASAMLNRPDYASALKKLEREDIRVKFSENQRWPQLDLKGSYGLNGLENSAGSSLDEALNANNRVWSFGLELKIPLGGGQKTRSELAAARHKKRQALLEIKALETSVKNAVNTAVVKSRSTKAQEVNYRRVSELKKRLFDVEMARLDQGKSNTMQVLEREDAYIQAENTQLESITENIKSIIELQLAEGTLLKRFSADVTEENK